MSNTTTAVTPRFWCDLGRHGDAVAVWAPSGPCTYRELAARVDEAVRRLGTARRLVLLSGANRLDTIVWYLAALVAKHPVMLCSEREEHAARLIEAYDPDVVIGTDAAPVVRHEHPVHHFHADLAVLLSTSGSTGSPKLVRLSHENLASNAAAIAEYLALGRRDRAITSLPLHYCYGLSVLHSHLAVGAGVVLTELSVVDPCFWKTFRERGVTGLAGVPHTFALLERVRFDAMSLPSLRYVTQAGGRLDPAAVRRYAELGARDGWELFVMYGQTEATARMAYLPPALAADHPSAVGVAIPGGEISIEPVADCGAPGQGEVVYRGPNVMMGYAESAADLALGRTVGELRTGDLGRRTPQGLVEITGRRNRFAKLFGLRIDLVALESELAHEGMPALCASDDARLCVATTADEAAVTAHLRASTGLAPGAIAVAAVPDLPRLPSGKPDHAAVGALVDRARVDRARVERPSHRAIADRRTDVDVLRELYGQALGVRDPGHIDDRASFVSLGGDSLSYVELSVALEERLGHLPRDWHLAPIADLARAGRRRTSRLRAMDTSAVLRAVAIVLIVGNHADLWLIPGGAHVLLAIAGYNLARFQLGRGPLWPSIARIAVPSMCWIGLVAATTDGWGLTHALLVRSWAGPPGARWSYWFIETLLALLVGTAVAFAFPAVRRLDRRHPGALPLVVTAAGLAIRFDLIDLPDQHLRLFRPQEVLWLFALGWAAARASSVLPRVLLAGIGIGAAWEFFGNEAANIVLGGGLLALLLLRSVPVPRLLGGAIAALASASLHIYLVHWQVLPHLDAPAAAVLASLVAGVTAWRLAGRLHSAGSGFAARARACDRLAPERREAWSAYDPSSTPP